MKHAFKSGGSPECTLAEPLALIQVQWGQEYRVVGISLFDFLLSHIFFKILRKLKGGLLGIIMSISHPI